jgi:hypothetical protein
VLDKVGQGGYLNTAEQGGIAWRISSGDPKNPPYLKLEAKTSKPKPASTNMKSRNRPRSQPNRRSSKTLQVSISSASPTTIETFFRNKGIAVDKSDDHSSTSLLHSHMAVQDCHKQKTNHMMTTAGQGHHHHYQKER